MTAYPYTLPVRDIDQLLAEVSALRVPGFLGVNGDGADVQILFAGDLGPGQELALDAVVKSHAPDPAGPLKRSTAAAVSQFLAAADPSAIAVRVIVRRLATWHNDTRERDGLPRLTEPEIVAQLLADAAAGLGAPIALP